MQSFLSGFFAMLLSILSVLGLKTESEYSAPIDNDHGGDPFIVETRGETYYTFTTGGSIDIRQIKAYNDTEVIEQKTVFYAGENNTVADIWAPEIHRIGNKWYIISCAVFDKNIVEKGAMPECSEESEHNDFYRYSFVLESKTDDIFGEYEFKGILAPSGMNSIDGTYLQKDGILYFIASTYKDVAHQCITISEMENPYTLKTDSNGNTVTCVLSTPEYKWETHGWRVNEGPAVLYHNNDIFIVYSASGFSSGHYCMGMLTFRCGDIMKPCNWTKAITQVHYDNPSADIYNAGHCSFLYRENGSVFMVYHANKTKEFNESPRLTYIKEVKFICGVPFFG